MTHTTEIDPAVANHTHSSEGVGTQPGRQDAAEVSILDLLIVIARRKAFIFKFVGISVAVAAVTSLLLPSWYTARTTILPPQQSSSLSSTVMNQLGNLAPLAALAGRDLNLKNPTDLYVALLKSRSVEDAMIQRFDLMSRYRKRKLTDARKKFESHREIESGPKEGLIQIQIEDKDPRRASEMANAYVEEFRKLSANLAITEASQRRIFFEQQLEDAKNKLADAEEELKKTELKTGLIQLDSQARAVIQSVALLRAQIAAKEVEIQSLRSAATEENPSMIVAQQELAALRNQLSKLGVRQGAVGDDLLLPKGTVPEAGLEYVRKLRDVRYREAIFELLARQFEMAKLDEAKQGSLIQVVDPAIIPDKRSFPQRAILVGLAFFAAVVIAFIWVLAERGLESAMQRPEDRERITTLSRLVSFKGQRRAA